MEANKKIKILIVDEDEASLLVYQAILKDYFEEIYKARNGQEAKEIIFLLENDKKYIDLALVHEWTRDMQGKEICQLLKEKNKKTRVIAVTANPIFYKPETAKEEGFDDYLLKPNNVKDFNEVIFRQFVK